MFTAPDSVNNYFKQTSQNRVSFTGDVSDWLSIAHRTDKVNCPTFWWEIATKNAAAQTGIDVNQYDIIAYTIPSPTTMTILIGKVSSENPG